EVVRVVGRRVACRALALAEEDGLPAQLLGRRALWVELSEDIELGGRREVEDLLELRHVVDLAAPLEDVHTLLGGDHGVAVEIGRALLEFGEVLVGLERQLRAEEPLDVHAAQGRRLDSVAKLLRTNVPHQVRRSIGAAVLMTVETGNAEARMLAAPVGGEVELLLGKRRQEKAEAFELLGVEDAVEELVVVVGRDEAAAGDVAEIGTRGEKDRRREFGQERVGQIEVEVEACEIPASLLPDFVDLEHGERHPALGMIRMRQRHEPRREAALLPDLIRRHLRERVPRHPGWQFHPDAALDRLAAAHAGTRDRTIAQVVTGGEEVPLTLLDLRFRGTHPREVRLEVFLVRVELRPPYTFVAMALLLAVLGVGAIVTMTVDIFPSVSSPVVTVIWNYSGLSPTEMQNRIVTVTERAFTTTVNGIEHIESVSLRGVAITRLYFHPNVPIEAAIAQVNAQAQQIVRVLPPGIFPPLIIQYNAASVPVLLASLSSDQLPEEQLNDLGNNFIRTQLVTIQGASVPVPY